MLRICFVTPEFPAVGGYGTYVFELSKRLAEEDFEVHVLTGRLGLGEEFPSNVKVHTFFTSGTRAFAFPAFELQVNERLRKLNRKSRFDFVHSNYPMFFQVPLHTGSSHHLITAHGSVVDIGRNVRPRFWRSHISEKLFAFGNPVFAFMERKALKRAKRIIAVSHFVKSKLEEHHRIEDDRVRVVYNGVDTELFKQSTKPSNNPELNRHVADSGGRDVLYVGRFYGVKDVETLLRAAPTIIKRHPDTHFLFRGAEKADINHTIDLLKTLGVPQYRYSFIDYIPRRLLPGLYSVAQVFVLTSTYEPLPYTLLEAMSCQNAAVATNVGGVKEILLHGSNGMLYKPGDHAGLAERVCQLLEDENLRRRIGEEARRTVQVRFNIEHHVAEFTEVLHGLA